MNGLLIYTTLVTVFCTYLIIITIVFGVQKSISGSYYRLPKSVKPIFTFYLWFISIGAIILGDTVLMFLAGSGIAFVGAAAAFKKKITHTVHMIGAASGILLSQLSIILDFQMWEVSFVFILSSIGLLLFDVRNKIWWLEILAFISIFYVLAYTL